MFPRRSDVWHGSGENTSDKSRLIMQVHYASPLVSGRLEPYVRTHATPTTTRVPWMVLNGYVVLLGRPADQTSCGCRGDTAPTQTHPAMDRPARIVQNGSSPLTVELSKAWKSERCNKPDSGVAVDTAGQHQQHGFTQCPPHRAAPGRPAVAAPPSARALPPGPA